MPDRLTRSSFSLLPRYFRETDTYHQLEKLCASFDDEFAQWNGVLDAMERFRSVRDISVDAIDLAAADLGLSAPGIFSRERFRRFLFHVPSYFRRKGDLDVISDAIRVLLDLQSWTVPYWTDPDAWVIGSGAIGDGKVGPSYRRAREDTWRIGKTAIGKSRVGDTSINPHIPRTFTIRLSRAPTADEKRGIEWIAKLFKGAEEHFIIRYPGTTGFWVLGTSRLEVDAVLAPGPWIIGTSKIGISNTVSGAPVEAPNPFVPPEVMPSTNTDEWVPTMGESAPIVPFPMAFTF